MRIHYCEQASPEWHALRKGRPTASEFRRIITAKGCKLSSAADRYIEQIIGEKMSLYEAIRAENFTSRAADWGHQTEAEARRWYAMETGADVRLVGLIETDDARFAASPDGLIFEGETPVGGLELKAPQPAAHMRYLLGKVLPAEHLAQVHGGLVVSGLKYWDFVSYAPGCPPFMVRTVPDAWTTELLVCLELFHQRLTETLARVRAL